MTPAISASGMTPAPDIVYPESDGKPMADNTKQFRWILLLFTNLSGMFAQRDDVFIAGDLLWYPVEGRDKERLAPDVLVVFGRPKKDRGSYKQWEENDIPVTVAFEILSPNNTQEEMIAKFLFYDQHGVEEYYVYDPEKNTLEIHIRGRATFQRIRPVEGFVSPRLGIRFQMTTPEMTVYKPNGERFLNSEEREAEENRQRRLAEQEKRRAEEATRLAEQEKKRAEQERKRAEEATRQADESKQHANKAEERENEAKRLARRVMELSRKARQGQASAEEQAELDRLEAESS